MRTIKCAWGPDGDALEMVFVEDLARAGEVEHGLRPLVPRKLEHELDVGPDDA